MINFYIETPIDQVIEHRIFKFSGWLASDQPIETMKILVNREEFPFLVAYGREDVAGGTGLPHAIGWAAHIPVEHFLANGTNICIIQVIVNNDAVETRYFRYKPLAKKSDVLIYFVHIPKTAGTSTHLALTQARHLRTLIVQKHIDDMSINQFNTLSSKDLDDYDVVYGHFPYGLHKRCTKKNFFQRKCKYVSVVRHPASHLLSCYYYLRDTMGDERIDHSKSIQENIFSIKEPTFDNYAVRYFTGIEDSVAVNEKHFEAAKANIKRNFLYVGTVENYSNTLENLSAYLGCKLEYYRENVTPHIKERADLQPETIQAIVDRCCAFDIQLYQWIKLQFSDNHWIQDLEGRSGELATSESALV